MSISEIINVLETTAPLSLQESYDNCGLLTGNKKIECTGILITLDVTEETVYEAAQNNCNLIVAHHPLIFKGLKKITGNNSVERTVIAAIKRDIAIYAIHTNLDNVLHGVNGKIASLLGMKNIRPMSAKEQVLKKLAVYVPHSHKEIVLNALFNAGAGNIGKYSECSFQTEGNGSFKAGSDTNAFVGTIGTRHIEPETKIEVIFPYWLQHNIISAMKTVHPYEEVAFDIFALENEYADTGSGVVGELEQPISVSNFFDELKIKFKLPLIRHTKLLKDTIQKIAICGGAGSFLTKTAIAAGADIFITGDVKYHEFFEADDKIVIADIGHYESEQFTIDLVYDILRENFPNFAVLKTVLNTNPVIYRM